MSLRKEFFQWMIDEVHLSKSTANFYCKKENKDDLPILCEMTERIYKGKRSSIKTGKQLRRAASKLFKDENNEKIDIPGLMKDLELIGREIQLQLMHSRYNAVKGAK
jgi:hypothetical protein